MNAAAGRRRRWPVAVAGLVLATAGTAGVVALEGTGTAEPQAIGLNRPVDAAAQDRTDSDAYNSPSLRRDPTDPANLALTSRIDGPTPSCSLQTSADGGVTWGHTSVPLPEVGGVGCFAPDVAFGPDGTLYMAFTSLAAADAQPTAPAAVWVVSSRDHGRSLSAPVKASGPLAFEVRLAADPVTPGVLHLVWLQAREVSTWGFVGDDQPIVASRSEDGGATWEPPVTVSASGRRRVVAPSPVAGPDGSLYVAYLDVRGDELDYLGTHLGQGGAPDPGPWSLVVARSGDGGKHWSETVVDGRLEPTQRFLVLFPPAPSAAFDLSRNRLYVGFHDGRPGDADVVLWASGDGGRTWSAPTAVNRPGPDRSGEQYLAGLAVAPNGRLDVVYYDRSTDPDGAMNDVSLSSSSDGARSFRAKVRLSDRTFDSRVGLGADRGMADLGDRMGLLSTDRRALAVWTDTRAGTVDDGRQDLAKAVVVFPAESSVHRIGRPAGLSALVAGSAIVLLAVVRRRPAAASS